MNKIFLVLFIGLSFQISAQSKYSIGFIASPDMNFIKTFYTDKSEGKLYYKPGFGYNVGIRARLDVNDVISVQTGFSLVSETIKTSKFDAQPYFPYTSSTEDPQYIEVEVIDKAYQIPLIFSFYFGEKWKVGFSTGVAYQKYYSSKSSVTEYYPSKDVNVEYKSSTGSSSIFGILGAGVERRLSDFILRAEPVYRVQFFDLNSSEVYKDNRRYSIGFNLSAYYRF